MSGARSEAGVALILVLVLLALLLTIAGEFAQATRLEGRATASFQGAVTAAHLAEGGYHLAAAELLPEALAHELDERGLLVFRRVYAVPDAAPRRADVPVGGGRLSYRITDEEARLNLNRATRDMLHRLLTELGVERGTRDVIVDSILDWRDRNEEHHLNGAESDYYLALSPPYRSKNADFDSVEELLQVQGVTRDIFFGRPNSPGLSEHLTVAGSGAVNVNTASATVLRALGFAPPEADLLIAGRPYTNLSTLGTQLRRGNQRTRSETFRIEAWGEVPGQARRALVASVVRQAGPDGIVRVNPLSWRWLIDAPAPDAPAPSPR